MATKIDPIKYFDDQFVKPMKLIPNIFINNALTSRDMLKFGMLHLNDGSFNGEQLLSNHWVNESVTSHVTYKQHTKSKVRGYGYYWWQRNFKANDKTYSNFYAAGNGGQYIIVIPNIDLVAVFTGINYNSMHCMQQPFDIISRYVIPSLL